MTNKDPDNTQDSGNYSEKLSSKEDLRKQPLYYVKPEKKQPILEKVEFDKKKKKRWIPLLIVLLVLGGSIPFIFHTCKDNPDPEKKIIAQAIDSESQTEEESSGQTEEILIEEFHDDTMIVEELENEIIEFDNTTELENMEKNFHVIVGSFENEINAHNLVQELQEFHQTMEVIEHNGIYRVAWCSLNDRDQAEIELDYIRNTLRKDAWIVYME